VIPTVTGEHYPIDRPGQQEMQGHVECDEKCEYEGESHESMNVRKRDSEVRRKIQSAEITDRKNHSPQKLSLFFRDMPLNEGLLLGRKDEP
jgi:hypothetical protein